VFALVTTTAPAPTIQKQSGLFSFPHELALLLYLLVEPLNATALGSLPIAKLKLISSGLLALTLILSLLSPRRVRWSEMQPSTRLFLRLLGAYCLLLCLTTATRQLPSVRYSMFAAFLMSPVALYVCESMRSGSFFRVVALATMGHLGFALAYRHYVVDASGHERLSGGSHPILLGFEAGVLLVLSVGSLFSMDRRAFRDLIGVAVGGATLFLAFSRTAIIATSAALVAMFVVRRHSRVLTRFLIAGLVAFVALPLLVPRAVDWLSRGNAASFHDATGRTQIWSQILSFRSTYQVRGFGFAALHDGMGPDLRIYLATNGEPSENAFLGAALVGGVLAALLLVVMLVVACRALVLARGYLGGASIGIAVLLIATSMFSDGPSGSGFQWFWLLACVSMLEMAVAKAPT